MAFNTEQPKPFSYDFQYGLSPKQPQNQFMLPNPSLPPTTDWLSQFAGGNINDPNNMSFTQKLMGGIDTKTGNKIGGFGAPLLGTAQGLFSGYQAFKAGKLAEDMFHEQKKAFSAQFKMKRTMLNNELRRRDDFAKSMNPEYKSTTEFI